MAEEVEIGRVNDYFAHISVAGIDLTGSLKVGDRIRIRGHTTDMEFVVESIQVEHEAVDEAKHGERSAAACRRQRHDDVGHDEMDAGAVR